VARLPPFPEVRSFASPPRGEFALSLALAEHNSTHSGVCPYTRRLKWLDCYTIHSFLWGRNFVAPLLPFDSPASSHR
jgi:hypothetical protein